MVPNRSKRLTCFSEVKNQGIGIPCRTFTELINHSLPSGNTKRCLIEIRQNLFPKFFQRHVNEVGLIKQINPFHANDFILSPLKTSKKKKDFPTFPGVIERNQ